MQDPKPCHSLLLQVPKHAPPPQSQPLAYVQLFITDNLIDKMVVETNIYAQQWITRNREYLERHKSSMVHYWINSGNTTREEMYAFVSVVVNMGLLRKSTIKSYWDSTNPSQSTPWFNERFNRDRFYLISKFLHFFVTMTVPLKQIILVLNYSK